MRFCVLGHTGMLGHTLASYLRYQGCHVSTISKRFSSGRASEFVNAIAATAPDWCINATGAKLTSDVGSEVLTEVNVDLPAACTELLPTSIGFIHASSDAVFSPQSADRAIDETPDATDSYGTSKAAGEAKVIGSRRFTIRCSFVGPDRTTPRNLLSWLLSATEQVNGYTNHFWNGITSLQWAKTALDIAQNGRSSRIVQLGTSPSVSKYQLLVMIASVWETNIPIIPTMSATEILRTLVPTEPLPPLLDQLRELKGMEPALHNFSI